MTIREWVDRSGLTQSAAAAALRVPHRTLVGWLAYGRTPSLLRIREIERRTGGSVTAADWTRDAARREREAR